MLDWLRRKIGCVSSHEEMLHGGISENNVNRFKVVTDSSLTPETSGVRSGILEVNDDELVHYQANSDPIRWSYRCLRRYGLGTNTFLFESGRRCSTGPGLFAFKCTHAEMLHNIFTEKLRRFAGNRNGTLGGSSLHRQADFSQPPNRYSDDVMVASNLAANHVVEEPYLTPLPASQSYANGSVITGQNQSYVNCSPLAPVTANYVNTTDSGSGQGNTTSNGDPSGGSYMNGRAIRELNYADLDLPQSDGIGFHQPSKKFTTASPNSPGMQYVNLQHSSDDEGDDGVFLPPLPSLPLSVDLAGRKADTTNGQAPSVGYMNVQSTGGRKAAAPTSSAIHSTQYTTIDFQKTVAIASTTKSTHSDSSQEGLRKTRHDSSADNLN